MKRPRNADCAKLRRPLKRSKITEGFYGSTFLYMKFLMVWALVLMADFILEFRFEYLWPFWLLMRSVYDSFKFQGLAFSVFFVSIAITSDVVCYLFIPVQWLFFAASTYVWVQYVWHTERGICLPTVSLWLLFVYIEASIRLRELKNLPFNLDLCRPFAAHCIGYPVVTLGFGFKTYVSYKLRLRKQKDVQKDNEFYIKLIQQALPPELQNVEKQKALPAKSEEEGISVLPIDEKSSTSSADKTAANTVTQSTSSKSTSKDEKDSKKSKSSHDTEIDDDLQYIEQSPPKKSADINSFDESAESFTTEQHTKNFKQNGISTKVSGSKLNSCKENSSKKGKNYNKPDLSSSAFANNKDESAYFQKLENDVKRLKTDLQLSRNNEAELKSQINEFILSGKNTRSELYQLQQDNENLQNKLHNLVTSRQKDKETISSLERKVNEEKKSKGSIEQQLNAERKAKKAEDAAAARAVALVTARGECCTDVCLSRRRDTENDLQQLKWDIQNKDDKIRQLEKEVQALGQLKEQQTDTEVLMSALTAMQDKTVHLENSLSAETRLKLDLFSALGEAKRQMEILQNMIQKRDQEIVDLKSKMSEVMALMPPNAGVDGISLPSSGNSSPSPLYSTSSSSQQSHHQQQENGIIKKSKLNPHASDYTPKLM
ncbi:macoilin-like isoform X2 [Mya arenaria]|uniref:macoilin-like isoform X2 n=1 Tax=Mya arenaria TaxID=6604 RepID=UPI0022E89FF7|nr:macoilin-like isoform X2 [Mya arenaria]